MNPIFETDVNKKEGDLIGRLVVGYSELELSLLLCVFAARDDFDEVFKAMYRSRGEKQRIDVADALGRHAHDKLGTGNEFSLIIAAMHICRRLRNQYAHTVWSDAAGGIISFASLEPLAKENAKVSNFSSLPLLRLNLAPLNQQKEYFEYVKSLMFFLEHEARVRRGLQRENPFSRSKPLAQPDFHIP